MRTSGSRRSVSVRWPSANNVSRRITYNGWGAYVTRNLITTQIMPI